MFLASDMGVGRGGACLPSILKFSV